MVFITVVVTEAEGHVNGVCNVCDDQVDFFDRVDRAGRGSGV